MSMSVETRRKISEKLKGLKISEETREKMRIAQRKRVSEGRNNLLSDEEIANTIARNKSLEGEKNPNWRGEKVHYQGLHKWVRSKLGKAQKCSKCGKKDGQIHWANKDHKYQRNTEDFIELCSGCHGEYDRANGFRRNIVRK